MTPPMALLKTVMRPSSSRESLGGNINRRCKNQVDEKMMLISSTYRPLFVLFSLPGWHTEHKGNTSEILLPAGLQPEEVELQSTARVRVIHLTNQLPTTLDSWERSTTYVSDAVSVAKLAQPILEHVDRLVNSIQIDSCIQRAAVRAKNALTLARVSPISPRARHGLVRCF